MTTLADVTAQPASGLNHIDALLNQGPGWNWLAPERTTLYYSFSLAGGNASDAGDAYSGSMTAFNATQQASALAVMAKLSATTGITFASRTDGTTADIHFAAANLVGASTAGFCSTQSSYTFNGSNTITSYTADAWVYLDNAEFNGTNGAPTAGGSGFEVLLHELGHALGLKHPFEGDVQLPDATDTTSFTVMSYTHVGGPYQDFNPYDIAALMFLYGGDGLAGDLGQGSDGVYLVGTAAGDALTSGSGDDTLQGGGGNDALNGGPGTDTAVYTGVRASYTISPSGTGYTISGPEGVDALGSVERARFSDQTVTLSGAPTNHAPTGSLRITGTPQQGQTLSTSSTVVDVDGLGAFSYQWQRSPDGITWSDLAAATGSSLKLSEAQVGLRLRAVVTYIDGLGTAELVQSSATASVSNVDDEPTGSVTVSGPTQQGRTLVATSTLADADGLGALAYQWQSSTDGSIWTDEAGATKATLQLSQTQVGRQLRVVVSYTDGHGSVESATSPATLTISNVNDAPTGTLRIVGAPKQGIELVATQTLGDLDGLGPLSFQWQTTRDASSWTDIEGATGVSFVPGQAQVGLRLRVVAAYTDGQGTAESVPSNPSVVVGNVNDAPLGHVSLSGVPRQGDSLQASVSLSDADGLGEFRFTWQSSPDGATWTPVTGATSTSFTPGPAQAGLQLRAQVQFTDGQGTNESVASPGSAAVIGVLTGSSVDDQLQGHAWGEELLGLQGQDRLTGLGGNDHLVGGDGIDTAVYAGVRSSYALNAKGASITVTALQGSDGQDQLDTVERVEFSDGSLAFDLDGNAGVVARLLGAVFGPAAVLNKAYAGIGLAMADTGSTADAIAQLALEARLGSGFAALDLVQLLYTQVAGVPAGEAELAFWVGALAAGSFTPASLTVMASELDLNEQNIDLVGLTDWGLGFV
jgi:hypothetical protein